HFLAMEYIEGIDLARLVKERGPLPVDQACDFIRQVAQGLQHAHEHGLVHRDIKPGHLLLAATSRDREGGLAGDRGSPTVQVLDMGRARILPAEGGEEGSGPLTQEGMLMGTLDFLAPEQAIDAHHVDIRADLYSLGCTFYYLLAGRTPFAGGS